MSTALAKINAEVKRLKKKHPNAKHVTLQKEAGKKYREGKLGGVRHKKKVGSTHKKKVRAHKSRHHVGTLRGKSHQDGVDRKKVDITIGSASSHIAAAKKKLEHEIATAEVTKFRATKKSAKNKVGKRIAALKSRYKKLC